MNLSKGSFKAHKREIAVYKSLKYLCCACALAAVATLLGIIIFIVIRGAGSLSFNFIFGKYTAEKPTLRAPLLGTLYLIVTALGIAAPVGILSAVFLSEYAKKGRFVNIIRLAAETLAAVPSIVYGLFGYLVFVVIFGWGKTLLGGGLTVSIMILPMVIRATEESLLSVPLSYREGSLALGTSKVRTVFSVVLPNAAPGIVSSLILGIGRVISESAVFILTIGSVRNEMPTGFMSQGTSLSLSVYFFGMDHSPGEAAATGIVLMVLVIGLNLLATKTGKLMRNKSTK